MNLVKILDSIFEDGVVIFYGKKMTLKLLVNFLCTSISVYSIYYSIYIFE